MSHATNHATKQPARPDKRSAFDVLRAHQDEPLTQANKLIKYLESANARKGKLVNLASEQALQYAKESRPDLF